MAVRALVREKFLALHRRLRGGTLTSPRVAASVSLGVFVGTSPFYGLHFFICAGLSYVLRLDLIVTYLAANISIPPMIPFLVFAEAQVGTLILKGHWLGVTVDSFVPETLREAGYRLTEASLALLVGWGVVGPLLAIVLGSVAFFASKLAKKTRSRGQVDELVESIEFISSKYAHAPPAHKHYVRAKLKMDPLTRELHRFSKETGPLGIVVDAGCGRGQFSLLLAHWGSVERICGFDHDEKKVRVAEEAASSFEQAITYETGDLRTAEAPRADTILLLDVLHYLPVLDQQAVIKRMAALLAPGGRLLIRETNHGAGVGAAFAKALEYIARILKVNRGEKLEFRAPGELVSELEQLDLQVTRHAPQGALDNVLLVASRKPSLS